MALAALAAQSSSSPCSSPGDYCCRAGELGGGDLNRSSLSLPAAKVWCSNNRTCAGFSVQGGKMCAGNSSALLDVHFKDAWGAAHSNKDSTWTTWLPPPPAPDPSHPCSVPQALRVGKVDGLQISGPRSANATVAWLQQLREWRKGCLGELKLSDAIYKLPQLEWGKTAYFQPLMMPFDRFFYNETLGNYSVERYLDSLTEQYSGIDSVLLWPTYTNIGVDDRNQFQLIESQPGGISGLRHVVDELHAHGVQSLWPYNPWDQGTRGGSLNKTKAGIDDAERLSQMLKVTNADGFFGDTISSSGLREFYDQGIKRGHPLAIQPEGGGTPSALNYSSVRVQIDHQPAAVHCSV